MREPYETLDVMLTLAENPCPPDQYQARQNELTKAIARILIEEHQKKIKDEYPLDRKEILHALGDLLMHPLFKILTVQVSVYQFEKELMAILLEVKDVKKKLSELWNIVNFGNPEGRMD